MRVRTYGFAGCLTRPPDTSTRNHPNEPTASKPVVPGCSCTPSLRHPDASALSVRLVAPPPTNLTLRDPGRADGGATQGRVMDPIGWAP